MRSYAIGDIHGHLDLLRQAHGWIAEDRARTGDDTAPLVHLGDLVDRGPDSAGVVEYLRTGIAQGEPWVVLKGNHDRMMALFLRDPPQTDPCLNSAYSWIAPQLGGLQTLASYGVEGDLDTPRDQLHRQALARVPRGHADFLSGLPLSLWRGPVFFAHAGIKPGVRLEAQQEDDLLWIRKPFHVDSRDHGALIVHGHTPVPQPTHYRNRVNLDSGVAFGGPLTAAVIEEREVWILGPEGRTPLKPG